MNEMSAGDILVSPERGTSRVLFRRIGAEAPPGDWDAGWRDLAVPRFVKLNAADWFVLDGDSAFQERTLSSSRLEREQSAVPVTNPDCV
jgi:hypothetical protein